MPLRVVCQGVNPAWARLLKLETCERAQLCVCVCSWRCAEATSELGAERAELE